MNSKCLETVTSNEGYTAEDISTFSYAALTSGNDTSMIWKPNPENITETLFSILTLNSSSDIGKLLDMADSVSLKFLNN